MDSTIQAALIAGGCSIVAAVLGALMGRSGIWDRLFSYNRIPRITGKWKGSWSDIGEEQDPEDKEVFVVERQKGTRVFGYITMESEMDKRWEFEGLFNGTFLQINYYPSPQADNKAFLDYGCYCLQFVGEDFEGFSIGYDWHEKSMGASTHKLKRAHSDT